MRQDDKLGGAAAKAAGLGLAYRPQSHSRAKRDRGWEQRQRSDTELCQVSYRGIPRGLNAAMKGIAAEHGITVSDVARLLLEYALEDYQAGVLQIVDADGGS